MDYEFLEPCIGIIWKIKTIVMTGEVAVLTVSSVSRVNSRNLQWRGNVEVGPKSVLPDEWWCARSTKFRLFSSLLHKVNGVSFARFKWSSIGLSRHGINQPSDGRKLSHYKKQISEASLFQVLFFLVDRKLGLWTCAAEDWQGYVTRISMWYQKPCVHKARYDLCMSHREHSLKLSVDPSSLWQCTQRLQFPRPSFRWLR